MMINGYEIVQRTNHYRRLDGFWYCDTWVRDESGSLRLVCILRELVEA